MPPYRKRHSSVTKPRLVDRARYTAVLDGIEEVSFGALGPSTDGAHCSGRSGACQKNMANDLRYVKLS